MNAMSKKYQRLKRQISNDNGITWNDMGNVYKVGNEMGGAGCTPRIYRTVQADPSIFECDGGNKFYVNEVQYSDNNGLSWTTEYRTRGEIMEELSEDCGVAYRWVDVDGEWICEEGDNNLIFEYTSGNTYFYLNNTKYTATASPYVRVLDENEVMKSLSFQGSKSSLIRVISMPDTSNVTNMSNMFSDCKLLHLVNTSNFDTSNVTLMDFMYSGCTNLKVLDLSSFDTSNVTSMRGMFGDCSSLISLDLSSFDTSNVTNMSYMFYWCTNLTSLDVSSWDTSNVTNVNFMFSECNSLRNLKYFKKTPTWVIGVPSSVESLDLSNFDSSNVTNMYAMFQGCANLTSLDLSHFDTSNVTNVSYMFSGCTRLSSLDISGWNLSNDTDVRSMFQQCTALNTIYMRGCNEVTINRIKSYKPENATIITE